MPALEGIDEAELLLLIELDKAPRLAGVALGDVILLEVLGVVMLALAPPLLIRGTKDPLVPDEGGRLIEVPEAS